MKFLIKSFTATFLFLLSMLDILTATARTPDFSGDPRTSDPASYNARYTLSQLSPNLHTFVVTLTVRNSDKKSFVDFILPAWRPGRYQIQNYAASVQEFEAFSEKQLLAVEKTDKQTWRVATDGKAEVQVRYKYFAGNPVDAGNSYCGSGEMYFNGSNLFVYTDETRNSPALLTIDYPDDWKVASQLRSLGNKSFDAETYDDLIDAPTVISPTLVHWQTKVRSALIHIYFQNDEGLGGSNLNERDVKADLAKIVEGQFALMQDEPFKEYAFIYHLVARPFSHGVEHKNSASMVMGPAAAVNQNYGAFLSLSSHEFFHVWNIKRIKPDVFMPYDYRKESYTPLLYISEGFTSYYGSLTLARSKQTSTSNYLSAVAANMTALQNNYGRKVQPLALSSFDAWLSGYGAGRSTNSVSFYSKGELIGLLLDLEIRHRTKNAKSLDDVMRLLNTEFAQQGRGFSAKDFKELVERTGTGSFAEFFERFIYGTDELPFAEKLAHAGLELRKSTRGVVTGMLTADENNFPVVKSIEPESPAFAAGLDDGDVLIALNGKSLMNQSLLPMLALLKAGDVIKLNYIRGGLLKEVKLTLKGRDTFSISKKAAASASEKVIFESWLAAKWDDVTI